MPPRIQTQAVSNSLLPYLSSSSTSTSSSSLPIFSASCHPSSSLPCRARPSSRPFSSTPTAKTRLRAQMFDWLNGEGAALKHHIPGSTNYLTALRERNHLVKPQENQAAGQSSEADPEVDSQIAAERLRRPFPLNPSFVSESILSEELRNEIYERVAVQKKSVRAVSVELSVDMRRVAAVVRLVQLEKKQRAQGKPLALPYARAVHEMVPTTPLGENGRQVHHESINDLPVHRLTDPQIFYPVSESRQFTRVDAGRVFSGAPALEHSEASAIDAYTQRRHRIETVGKADDEQQVLQPPEVRIPHPHLVAHERDRLAMPGERRELKLRYEERLKHEEAMEEERKRLAQERREKRITKVQPESSRFEFHFKDVVVSKETTGADGRGSAAPGRRYGVPTYDRKKGQVKIPTSVVV